LTERGLVSVNARVADWLMALQIAIFGVCLRLHRCLRSVERAVAIEIDSGLRRDSEPTVRTRLELVQCQIECQMRVFEGKSGLRIFNVIRNLLISLRPPAGSSPSLSTITYATHAIRCSWRKCRLSASDENLRPNALRRVDASPSMRRVAGGQGWCAGSQPMMCQRLRPTRSDVMRSLFAEC